MAEAGLAVAALIAGLTAAATFLVPRAGAPGCLHMCSGVGWGEGSVLIRAVPRQLF